MEDTPDVEATPSLETRLAVLEYGQRENTYAIREAFNQLDREYRSKVDHETIRTLIELDEVLLAHDYQEYQTYPIMDQDERRQLFRRALGLPEERKNEVKIEEAK